MKRRMVSDVDFKAVKEKAEAITPVPGGVGPMLITMLWPTLRWQRRGKQLKRLKDSSQTLVLFVSSL